MVVKNFTVLDMICANCAARIQGLEDDLPGVVSVTANYQNKKITVKYDETRISEKEIINAVRMLGYTAASLS